GGGARGGDRDRAGDRRLGRIAGGGERGVGVRARRHPRCARPGPPRACRAGDRRSGGGAVRVAARSGVGGAVTVGRGTALQVTTTRIRPCGEAALLRDWADLAGAVALAERIERARIGAVDVVAGARTVLVTTRRPAELPQLRRALDTLLAGGGPASSRDPLPSGYGRPRHGG